MFGYLADTYSPNIFIVLFCKSFEFYLIKREQRQFIFLDDIDAFSMFLVK